MNRRTFLGLTAVVSIIPSISCAKVISYKKHKNQGMYFKLGNKFIYGKLPVEVSYKEYPFDIDFPAYIINSESVGDNHTDILNMVRNLYPEAKKNHSKMWIYITKERVVGVVKWQ